MGRNKEIQRLIGEGLSDREIARTLRCRRTRVRAIRDLGHAAAQTITAPARAPTPDWATRVEWRAVEQEMIRGFELKRIWDDRVSPATTYPNFWKYLSNHYPALLKRTVTLREFSPGTHCEVDWAGDKIAWWDARGRRHEAHVFIGILCHSQLLFAWAAPDERKSSWLTAHQKMYSAFGGVPRVTVPDNLKTGVKKAHLYDPDLNPAYTELATFYGTAVVPARVKRPRDKALVENGVGLILRLFNWVYRDRKFHSLPEVNEALQTIATRINDRIHTRFRVSRRERFETLERVHLKPLPAHPFEEIEWKTASVHPDCTIAIDSATYSVPHIHRWKEVRVKLTARHVEIFRDQERLALHVRDRSRSGVRVIDPAHLPPNSQAYREATPQNILSQARFLSAALHAAIDRLFQDDTCAHLRRAQGFIRHARTEIDRFGRNAGEARVAAAVAQMERFGKYRVSFFAEQIERLRKQTQEQAPAREIARKPGNPMLRRNEQTAGEPSQQVQENRDDSPEQLSLLAEEG